MFECLIGNQPHTLTDGDLIELSLTGPLTVTVSDYDGERVITTDSLELSLDGENWQPNLTLDFDAVIGVEIWVRPGTANSGIVEVQDAGQA